MNNSKPSLLLSNLILETRSEIECIFGDINIEISSVEYDSRKVTGGALFVAVPGFVSDGHSFIKNAVNNGAKAVLISRERINDFLHLRGQGVVVLAAQNTRAALSAVSSAFFGHPSSRVMVIGITGTNGKTSITYMLEAVLKKYGLSTGVIGTVNYRWNDKIIGSANTTPESRDLQEIFARMAEDGVKVIIIEVSSHALKLSRTDDIEFDIAIFTNLTRDHQDFHESFEDYFNSKRKIFDLLEKSRKDNKTAVLNIDDEYGRIIISEKNKYSFPVYGFGMSREAEFRLKTDSILNSVEETRYELEKPVSGIIVKLRVVGSFQIYNSLCAFAVCYLMDIPVDVILEGLSGLSLIPGRFNRISTDLGFSVIVDYAHTDDAVSKLLASARELNPARIITLLGCGGNRDKTKRPLMGKAAVLNSDWVIFTSDNPRDEDPDKIIGDIVSGLTGNNFEVITDREQAIKKAVNMAGNDELIVIAGKGHEDYQEIKGRKIHFDDHEVAKKYIEQREAK